MLAWPLSAVPHIKRAGPCAVDSCLLWTSKDKRPQIQPPPSFMCATDTALPSARCHCTAVFSLWTTRRPLVRCGNSNRPNTEAQGIGNAEWLFALLKIVRLIRIPNLSNLSCPSAFDPYRNVGITSGSINRLLRLHRSIGWRHSPLVHYSYLGLSRQVNMRITSDSEAWKPFIPVLCFWYQYFITIL